MILLLILIFLGMGFLAQRLPIPAETLAAGLNRYVLWLAIPALALQHLSQLPLHWGLLVPASVAWISFLVAWPWVMFGQKLFAWDRSTTGCLLLTVGLGNTSFVGFPMLRWLYGEHVLPIAIFIDLPGSFLVLSTLGLLAGSFYIGQEPQRNEVLRRIVSFPPFMAFGLALSINLLALPLPTFFLSICAAIGSSLTPAALIAVGLHLQFGELKNLKNPLAWGLVYRLALSPLLIWGIFGLVLRLEGETLGVSVLEGGMAPMITASIVATSLGLNPPLASLIVSLGIALSLVSVPLWYTLLQIVG